MLIRPSQRVLEDIARVSRSMTGDDAEVVRYLVACREDVRDALENTLEAPRMHQLQGASQVLSELIHLYRKAPEAVHRSRQ